METKKQKSTRDQRQMTRTAEDDLKIANAKPVVNEFELAPKDRRIAKEVNAALSYGHAIADRKEKLGVLAILLSLAKDKDKKSCRAWSI